MAAKSTKRAAAVKKLGGETAQVNAADAGLALVSRLAQMQRDAELKVAAAEDALAEAKNNLKQIAEVDLPEAMREVGLETFVTEDGLEVKRKDEVECSISEANRPAAFSWLIAHQYGGLIKLDVAMHFDRGEQKKAEKLAEQLRKKGLDVNVKQTIHPQTLKAFVKERIADTESEVPFPLELFGAFPYVKATVKPKKNFRK